MVLGHVPAGPRGRSSCSDRLYVAGMLPQSERDRSQCPVALNYKGGQAPESSSGDLLCWGLGQPCLCGGREILYETSKEAVSRRLKKCKLKSIKVPLVSARMGKPRKSYAFI